jgi:hypothetical protein
MATTVASTMTPANNKTGQSVTTRLYKITDIPDTMNQMSWPVAAALMTHWFEGEPWPNEDGGMDEEVKSHRQFAPQKYIEDSIVKMDWAMQFDRTKNAVDHLRKSWNNTPALKEIRANIKAAFESSPVGVYPLSFDGSAVKAEKFGYFNFVTVEFDQWGTDDVNELRGALANFNVHVIAEGRVEVTDKSIVFFPTQLAFYLEDSYDFNDGGIVIVSQVLGYWGFGGLIADPAEGFNTNMKLNREMNSIYFGAGAGATPEQVAKKKEDSLRRYRELESKHYILVQNSDFRDYRDAEKKGGDFRVYSDVLYESVTAEPIEILVK